MSTTVARLLAALLLAGLLLPTPRSDAEAASDGAPMLFGLAYIGDWRAELDDFASQQGKAPAFFQIFWRPSTFDAPHAWAGGILADLESRGIRGWIEWLPDDLAAMARGDDDQRIRNFYDAVDDFLLGAPGRGIVIAPLPEVNLDEQPWCCDPVAYQQAFRRMRLLAAEAGLGPDQVRFAFSVNGFSTRGRSYDQFWPGDEHVDLLGFSRLNRGTNHDGWRDYDNVFGQPIRDLAAQIGATKPIMVAQTGSVTAGGDRGQWLRDMFSGLATSPQVIGALWFNRDKGGSDFRIHSKVAGIPLDGDARAGYDTWSAPSASAWLFDGRLDDWVRARGGTTATWPPSTDDPPPVRQPWDQNLGVTSRVGTGDPTSSAIAISQIRFPSDAAGHVVLSRDDKFPDALAGTPLLGEGPLLLAPSGGLTSAVRAELDRVLPSGGRAYLLGGTGALSAGIEDELTEAGYDVVRLRGADRFETSRAIALEVMARYPDAAHTVLVARGFGTPTNPTAAWADSVTGGGFAAWSRHPVVLSDSGSLSSQAADVLERADRARLLGGRSALSDQVLAQSDAIAPSTRVSGPGRDATAVQILTELWQRAAGEGRYLVIDGYGVDGWAYGLPAAGLAADFAAPLLPVAPDTLPGATADAVSSCFTKRVQTAVIGAASVVSDAVLQAVEGRDNSCA